MRMANSKKIIAIALSIALLFTCTRDMYYAGTMQELSENLNGSNLSNELDELGDTDENDETEDNENDDKQDETDDNENDDEQDETDDKKNDDEQDEDDDKKNDDEQDETDGEENSDSLDSLNSLTALDYIQLLREMFYSTNVSFSYEHIEWVLSAFEHDIEFLKALYFAILEDESYAQLFLFETYELYSENYCEIIPYYANVMQFTGVMPYLNLFENYLEGESVSAWDSYIKNFTKTAAKNGFRNYDIEFNLAIEPELVNQTPAEVMLVIDVGLGNDQYDIVMKGVKAFAERMFSVYGSRVGFVAYHGGGIRMVQGLVNTYQEFEAALGNVEKGNNSKPNIQEPIIRAKYALNIADGEYNYDGNKAIVFLTANSKVSSYYSDSWTGSDRIDIESLPISNSTIPQRGYKRWSYMEKNDGIKYFSGPDKQLFNTETLWTLNILEGQYTVSQGIDFYVIGYDSGADLLPEITQMTWKMLNPPDQLWDGDKYLDYAPNRGVDASIGDTRAKLGNDGNLKAIYEEIATTIIKEAASSIQVTDVLNENFEALLNGRPIPYEELAAGAVNIGNNLMVELDGENNQRIIWNVGNGLLDESVRFNVRVKDERIWPEGKGLEENAPGVEAGLATKVEYTANGGAYLLELPEQPLVKVDPLISGSADITNINGELLEAILKGDSAVLNSYINSGNGDYSYQWYKMLDDDWIELEGYSGTYYDGNSGINLDIKLEFPMPDIDKGHYEYLLAIVDNVAKTTGYENSSEIYIEQNGYKESVIQANYGCSIEIFEPVLKINVIANENSADISGWFETEVIRTGSTDDIEWYFMGLANKVYNAENGIIRGNYYAETYVPYGFEVTQAESVEITLFKDGDIWTGYEKEITIIVSKTDPWYFFDWAWPEKGSETGVKPDVVISAVIPSKAISLIGTRKRWLK